MTAVPQDREPQDVEEFFDALDDESKVQFVLNEHADEIAHLTEMIAAIEALRAEVNDPDGYASLTIGDDGRLLSLVIHDAAVVGLSHLALERRLNDMVEVGVETVFEMRRTLPQAFDF